MPTAMLRRYRKAFLPVGPESERALAKVKNGETIRVGWRRARSPEQHDMWWGLVRRAWENQRGPQQYHSAEDFGSAVLCALGHCDVSFDGERLIAKSIAFGNLGQDEFNSIVDATCVLLAEKMGVTISDLRSNADLPPAIRAGDRLLATG